LLVRGHVTEERHPFMKLHLALAGAALLCLLPIRSYSQFGPAGGVGGLGNPASGPRFGGALGKLFGENAFTAKMEMEIKEPGSAEVITMPGRMSFLDGKTRFEM